jgi:hypothetical protein
MSAPSTFSASRILSKLGVRSRIQPEYRTRDMTPVVILADMSRSYAPEAVEARAFAASQLLHNGTSVDWELFANAPGGLIIEHIGITSDQAAAIASFGISTTSLGFGVSLALRNIGGEPVNSRAERGFDTYAGGGWNWPVPFTMPGERMFIPAGSYLQARSYFIGAQWGYFFCVFREIPESLGAP